MTAGQEWSEKYNRLHARPGRRYARISTAGYRILNMLKPFPWEDDGGIGFDAQQIGPTKVEISWLPEGDSFVVGHAHGAPSTGFPRADAARIMRGFDPPSAHGRSRTRLSGPRVHGERFAPGYTKHAAQYEQATRTSKPPRYVVYVDGNPTGRWDDRADAFAAASRASIAGLHGHEAAVKDTHTGKFVGRFGNRIGSDRTRRFSLVRHNSRPRYRGH
jgi:hypothetical protein